VVKAQNSRPAPHQCGEQLAAVAQLAPWISEEAINHCSQIFLVQRPVSGQIATAWPGHSRWQQEDNRGHVRCRPYPIAVDVSIGHMRQRTCCRGRAHSPLPLALWC